MGYLYFIKVQSVTSSLPAITLTETLPAITSFSTIFQTVAVDADTVTQTSIEVCRTFWSFLNKFIEFKNLVLIVILFQKITETLPVVTITKTSEILVTETPQVITSTSIISQTVTADATTIVQTSIEVFISY